MNKEGNSYTNLLKMMQQEGYNKDVSITIGKVNSISPLSIVVNNYTIEEGDFYISDHLVKKEYEFEIEINGSTKQPAKIIIEKPLELNDFVFVMIDGNDFYIIDKVVS